MFTRVRGHTLLASELRDGITVVDGGANHGGFVRALGNHCSGQFDAIEANPELASALEQSGDYRSVTNAAITGADGRVSLNIGENDESSSILPLPELEAYGAVRVAAADVAGISLATLLANSRELDLLKLDIEGAEVDAVLATDAEILSAVRQISIEFHGGSEFGFRLKQRVEQTIEHLQDSGFIAFDFEPGHRDALFVRRDLASSDAQILLWKVSAVLRYGRWIGSRMTAALGRWRDR